MKVTALTAGKRDPNRVNVSVDGTFRFSLTVSQVVDTGLKVGRELTDDDLTALEERSQYGKLYQRALEYVLMRPRSAWEVREYLRRKTKEQRYKKRSGETAIRPGVDPLLTDEVFQRLIAGGYVDDQRFAAFWVEHRHQRKGASRRKLEAELRGKGVEPAVIAQAVGDSERSDDNELQKIIARKRARYSDDSKLMAYLARQGFRYDDIRAALDQEITDW